VRPANSRPRAIGITSRRRNTVEARVGYEAYYYLGNISYGRNDFAKAKDLYDHALKIRVNYAESVYGIGHMYRRQNQIYLAVAQFDKVIKMQPRFGDAYVSRGDVHAERMESVYALADYEKAIDCYEEQIKSLNATIAYADARSQSPLMQSEKKRSQRDKTRVEALLNAARQYKSEVQENLRKSP